MSTKLHQVPTAAIRLIISIFLPPSADSKRRLRRTHSKPCRNVRVPWAKALATWSAETKSPLLFRTTPLRSAFMILGIINCMLIHAAETHGELKLKPKYFQNFDNLADEKIPDDLMVLMGRFRITGDDSNRFLELPGSPLETFGLLFGSEQKENFEVSVKIKGTSHGRRHPAFGIGINGLGGYRLQVEPGKKTLEIFRADESVIQVPFTWKKNSWIQLKFRISKSEASQWLIQGKAWSDQDKEPDGWLITLTETEEPFAGRASIWGIPYSGIPILFDALTLTTLP
ncbi:MAG TPA: hypothetical protein EYQ50_02000 [Verrucomicrobiales bacterium]|nr:hypothetical protein [Verrucomicrobiales bacterium]